MPWALIIEWGLKLLGWGISKHSQDKETNRKFLELAHHIQSKGLISAKMRFEVDDRLAGLDDAIDNPKKKEEE